MLLFAGKMAKKLHCLCWWSSLFLLSLPMLAQRSFPGKHAAIWTLRGAELNFNTNPPTFTRFADSTRPLTQFN